VLAQSLILITKSKLFSDFRGYSAIIWSKFEGVLDGFGASYLATSELVSEYFFSNFGASLRFQSNYLGFLCGLEQVLQEQVYFFSNAVDCSRNSYRTQKILSTGHP